MVDSEEILEYLGINPRDSDLVKAISKQLESLEAYGRRKASNSLMNKIGGRHQMGKVTISYPYIPISRIEFVKDDDDDFFAYITDTWEIWECLNGLKRNFRDLIQLFYEDVDQKNTKPKRRNNLSYGSQYSTECNCDYADN